MADKSAPQAQPDGIPKKLRGMADTLGKMLRRGNDEFKQAHDKLIDDYLAIEAAATEGKHIGARDFQKAEAAYNHAVEVLEAEKGQVKKLGAEAQQEIADEAGRRVAKNPSGPSKEDTNSAIIKEFNEELQKAASPPKAKAPPPQDPFPFGVMPDPDMRFFELRNNVSTNAAFVEEFVYHPLNQKNLEIKPGVNTAEGLVSNLLEKNPGVALGDIHSFSDSTQFLNKFMKQFKAEGGDTIYMEFPSKDFERLQKLSPAEMRAVADTHKIGNQIIRGPDEQAKNYGTTYAEDTLSDAIRMMATAKENGVRIVDIDKPGPVREAEVELSMPHRLASTNYEWLDTIKQDQAQKKTQGKYIVWTGAGHLTGDPLHPERNPGLVSQALGIPTMAFTQGTPGGPAFERSNLPNGVDYYLAGSSNYPKAKEAAMGEALDDTAQAMKNFPAPLNMAAQGVKALADQFRKDAKISYRLKSYDADTSKGPAPSSGSPAPTPAPAPRDKDASVPIR